MARHPEVDLHSWSDQNGRMLRSASLFISFFTLSLLVSLTAAADLRLPNGIGSVGQTTGRQSILQELGYGTSSKLIAEPYPMGGYRGLEISLTYETLPTDQLNQNSNPAQDPLAFSRVTIGKGLYKNVDIQMNFIPFDSQSSLSGFGAIVKWMFLEGELIPYNFSFVAEGNQTNFNNQLIEQSMGADVIFGGTFDLATLYVGTGWLHSNGEFRSPDAPAVTAIENVSNFHYFAGAVLRWEPVFVAAQLDQFQQTMLSFRLGVRL